MSMYGNNLRTIRQSWGLNQTQMGILLGGTKEMVQSYELDRAKPKHIFNVRLRKYCGVSLSALTNESVGEDSVKMLNGELFVLIREKVKRFEEFKEKHGENYLKTEGVKDFYRGIDLLISDEECFFNYASNIRAIREKWDISQEDFGHLLGATRAMIQSYERGKAQPNKYILSALSEKIGISPEDILSADLTLESIPDIGRVEKLNLFNRRLQSMEVEQFGEVQTPPIPIFETADFNVEEFGKLRKHLAPVLSDYYNQLMARVESMLGGGSPLPPRMFQKPKPLTHEQRMAKHLIPKQK